LKHFFYVVIAQLVRMASRCMFSQIEIRGMERVPWQAPCIVSPNHQNAFIDALLIGAFAPVKMGYLSRSDAFGTPFDWFLDALEMVPVYRRRDGYEKLSRNKQIFAEQRKRLGEGNSLLIFSEAEHAHTYHLRPLSKGSSRFALQTQAQIESDVWMVPVGLNYYHHRRPGFKVSIVFGEPIPMADYEARYRERDAETINELRDDLTQAMQDCLLVPEKTDDYRERIDRINRKNEALPFPAMKRALQSPESLEAKDPFRPGLQTLAAWISPLNAVPLWGTKGLMRWVDDPVFASSMKLAVGMFGLPLWWALLFAAGTLAVGVGTGAVLAGLGVVTIFLRIYLIRLSNPPHQVE
jgi:1-acyl-sn-glycerol-3-phosphate acyltransferase